MKRRAKQDREASEAKEVPFSFDELFFSRTNEKGHILFGNDVFQRVSMYSWEELIDKPHNIVRHEDMPRAVFWLLWDTIKRGEPIGAYVKNRAKDGGYYWVFAIMTPAEGGYLSVRLKPSSPLLPLIEREYLALTDAEQSRRLKPAESAQMLLDRLAQLGFKDYGVFTAAALAQEIRARDQYLGRAPDSTIRYFEALGTAAQKLLMQAASISTAYEKSRDVPLNLRVQAAKLGEAAATVGVISVNYKVIAADIKNMMDEFTSSSEEVFKIANKEFFLFCASRLQKEMLELFLEEENRADSVQQKEAGILERQHRSNQKKSVNGLLSIAGQTERFQQTCVQMKHLAFRLQITYIMAKTEIERLSCSKHVLNEAADKLDQCQAEMADSLSEIDSMNRVIQENIQRLADITHQGDDTIHPKRYRVAQRKAARRSIDLLRCRG